MTSTEPIITNTSSVIGEGLRMTTGVDILETWWQGARQIELNAMGDALFALLDRSVYADYEVIDDPSVPRDIVVVVRENLALRVRLYDVATFGVVLIGRPVDVLAPIGESTR